MRRASRKSSTSSLRLSVTPLEAVLSAPRARLSLTTGRPLDIGDVRVVLFTTLWARSQGGQVVSRPDGSTALEDLRWLRLEPDPSLSAGRKARCQAVAEELLARGQAYPCFCTPAELREMYTQQASSDGQVRYDGRCRRLSVSDIEALRKAGRHPCVRLHTPEAAFDVTDAQGHTTHIAPGDLDDFRLMLNDGNPSDVFGDLVDDHEGEATLVLWSAARRPELPQRAVLARVLGWQVAPVAFLADWHGPDGKTPVFEGQVLTLSALRTLGYHPKAILRLAAAAGWDPGDDLDLDAMAARFHLDAVSDAVPPFELPRLRAENASVLKRISEDDLVASMVDHLDRRGYPMSEREPAWQRRFVAAVLPEMETLADAESMAALLLTPTVDYDREVARTLREPATQALVTQFEAAMVGVDSHNVESWRDVLTRFRAGSAAPGRALATLRLVLTGQRAGPNLPALLSLLGIEGCRARIEKARRYAGS